MTLPNAYLESLLVTNPLREPLLRRAIEALQFPPGSKGLDAGCGIGLQSLLLAQAVGEEGHIIGLDLAPDLLAYGEQLVAKAGLSRRISFKEGNISRLPFAENSFDWVWSADCIGYPIGELSSLLPELMRVVKPGGSIVLLGWSSQQLLPGYPFVEAQLNAACSGYLPHLKGKDPALHFARALHWLHQAGLEEITAQTLVGQVQAPPQEEERLALITLFEMLWEVPPSGVSAGQWEWEWSEYQRLCRPGSPDFILNQPGYYAFFTYTMFRAKLPWH